MIFRNIENRLAIIAAVVVLVGVTSAAGNALADENTTAHLEVPVAGSTSATVVSGK